MAVGAAVLAMGSLGVSSLRGSAGIGQRIRSRVCHRLHQRHQRRHRVWTMEHHRHRYGRELYLWRDQRHHWGSASARVRHLERYKRRRGRRRAEFGRDHCHAPVHGALTPDQLFKFSDVLHYANQTQGGGSALGWSMEDSSGNALFDFHTAGGTGLLPHRRQQRGNR